MHGFDDEECLDILETTCTTSKPNEDSIDDVADDIHVIRTDHNEGFWEKTVS